MTPLLKPWQFALLTLAGWINRSQQEAIEYLGAENQVLVEQLNAAVCGDIQEFPVRNCDIVDIAQGTRRAQHSKEPSLAPQVGSAKLEDAEPREGTTRV